MSHNQEIVSFICLKITPGNSWVFVINLPIGIDHTSQLDTITSSQTTLLRTGRK